MEKKKIILSILVLSLFLITGCSISEDAKIADKAEQDATGHAIFDFRISAFIKKLRAPEKPVQVSPAKVTERVTNDEDYFVMAEICNNLFDDDNDGLIDCFDDDCSTACASLSQTGPVCCLNHNTKTCHFEENFIEGMCEGNSIYPVFTEESCGRRCIQLTYRYTAPLRQITRVEEIPVLASEQIQIVKPSRNLICFDSECLYTDEVFDFLIVTRPMFVNALSAFIDWKVENGFNVGLLTVDFIAGNFNGENTALKIRNAMHSLRRTNNISYVLLVGDTYIAPGENVGFVTEETILDSYSLNLPWNVPMMYYDRTGTENTDVIPSDLPYTNTVDWLNPPIVNSHSHELNFIADLYVGRWPIRTADEVEQITKKTRDVGIIEKLILIYDNSFGDLTSMPPLCEEWPPPSSGREFFCYNAPYSVIRKKLFDKRIDYDLISVNVSDPVEAANARRVILSTKPNIALIEEFHGGRHVLRTGSTEELKIMIDDIEEFEGIFPMFDAKSCLIGSHYMDLSLYWQSVFNTTDCIAEVMLKSSKGPAFFVQIPNEYYFYRSLLEGKSIGESYYSGTDVYIYGPNPFYLFGDPSLPLFDPNIHEKDDEQPQDTVFSRFFRLLRTS